MKQLVLLNLIERMRSQLNDRVKTYKSLSDPDVVELSQRLDKLLVLAQQCKNIKKRKSMANKPRIGTRICYNQGSTIARSDVG